MSPPLAMIRTPARWLAVAVMAAHGVILGVLCGHLWLVLFVVPSPMAFMARREMWPIEAPIYSISAILGAGIFIWLALGTINGHFGFNAPVLPGKRTSHVMTLGATYGAFAGAVLFTLASQTIALTLV